jgi:hypothetical protein
VLISYIWVLPYGSVCCITHSALKFLPCLSSKTQKHINNCDYGNGACISHQVCCRCIYRWPVMTWYTWKSGFNSMVGQIFFSSPWCQEQLWGPPRHVGPTSIPSYTFIVQCVMKPIAVATRSKAWVCCRSLAGIAVSNSAGAWTSVLVSVCVVR